MKELSAEDAWKYAIDNSNTSLKKDDLMALSNLGKLLGKTNVEGQISEIELLEKSIDEQIILAEEEKRKNEKLYRSLGIIIGLTIVIILI